MKFFFHKSFFIRSFVQIEFTFFYNTVQQRKADTQWNAGFLPSPKYLSVVYMCAVVFLVFALIVSHSLSAKRTVVFAQNFFLFSFISLYSFFCFVFAFARTSQITEAERMNIKQLKNRLPLL